MLESVMTISILLRPTYYTLVENNHGLWYYSTVHSIIEISGKQPRHLASCLSLTSFVQVEGSVNFSHEWETTDVKRPATITVFCTSGLQMVN